jgi:hypothetical protein
VPKPKYPTNRDERARAYLHCMLEIEHRLKLIEGTLAGPTPNLFKVEVGMLQLRLIAELIAMACLVAQGDYRTQRAFREKHCPAEIFSALERHYPRYFPQPAASTVTGSTVKLIANSKPHAFRVGDVVSLWNRSGDVLHRGSLDKYLKRTFRKPPSTSGVMTALHGLRSLLECHIVRVETEVDRETVLIIHFLAEGWIGVDFAEADPSTGRFTFAEGFSGRRDD